MARYVVRSRYHSFSDAQHWGPWAPGTVVDLDEERAAWVNFDSPGTLEPEAAAEQEVAELETEEPDAGEPAGDAASTEAESPQEPVAGRPARNRKHAPGQARA